MKKYEQVRIIKEKKTISKLKLIIRKIINDQNIYIKLSLFYQSNQVQMKLGDKRKLIKNKLAESTQQGSKLLAGRYQIDSKIIGKGVSSTVMAAIDLKTNRKVAIKKITRFLQNKHESLRILRQIILLRILQHPNIIKLRQVILEGESKNQLYLVLDYLPYDIKRIFKSNRVLTQKNIKQIVFQILAGLNYCQQCQVLHRDLKPQNILTTEDLSEVKLCDFGLARAVMTEEQKQYEQKKQEKETAQNKAGLSAHVTTRWYRAPQLIILQKKYNSAIDMWSVGCILAELTGMLKQNTKTFMQRKVLFPGKACYPLSPPKNNETNYKKINDFPHSVSDQLSVIFDVLGTPDDINFITDERARNYIKSFGKIDKKPFNKLFDYMPAEVEDFLEKSLKFNPSERLTIGEALKHPLFDEVRGEYEANINIIGEPVITDIEGLTIEQIKERVIQQYQYYQKANKEEEQKIEQKTDQKKE